MGIHYKYFMFLLFITHAHANQLQKVLHNKRVEKQGTQSDSRSLNLQIASLVLCFEQEPKVLYSVKKRSDTKEEHLFFIPNAKVELQEVRKSIVDINGFSSAQYSISMNMKKQGNDNGLFISVVYNSDEVQIEYELFDSISMQKCINIKLYDKKILNKLKSAEQPALVMAANKRQYSVVIDYGHGGVDSGTRSSTNILEKDVNLAIGTLVTKYLQEQGVLVYLCRDADVFVPLDDRITYANSIMPSLFVSIHANASSNPTSSGIETFCLNYAALRSQASTLSAAEKVIIREFRQALFEKSKNLAYAVHTNVIGQARQVFENVVDRQLKYAVPQVLLGIQVPGILIELGFLSHQKEAELLGFSFAYQKSLAQGIAQGIISYLTSFN